MWKIAREQRPSLRLSPSGDQRSCKFVFFPRRTLRGGHGGQVGWPSDHLGARSSGSNVAQIGELPWPSWEENQSSAALHGTKERPSVMGPASNTDRFASKTLKQRKSIFPVGRQAVTAHSPNLGEKAPSERKGVRHASVATGVCHCPSLAIFSESESPWQV